MHWRDLQCIVAGMNSNDTKAAVWMRVSTDEQRSDNQRPEIERFAAHHRYQVSETYELDDSAWNGGKDGGEYQAMLKRVMDDAWQGKFEVLIVWALDRLTRGGAEDALRILRQLRERGCTVVSIQESWLNGSSEVQDVLISFAGWVAQQESARRSARIKAAIARGKAEGRSYGGRKPGQKDKRKSEARSVAAKVTWAKRKASAA